MRTPHAQQGFVVALTLGVLAVLIGFMYLAISTDVSQQAKTRQEELQNDWLNEARTALNLWYERNKNTIDADPNAITQATAFAGAGIVSAHGVQFQSTARLSDGAVQFHRIAIWLPQLGVTGTGFDANGVFQQGAKGGNPAQIRYALIDGRLIELETLRATQDTMDKLGQRFESWFKLQSQQEPNQGVTVNYFRADSCAATPPVNRLGCIDSYTQFTHNSLDDVRSKLGINADDVRDDWGGIIEFTNSQGLPAPPPFSIGLRASTPWGTPTTAQATVSD